MTTRMQHVGKSSNNPGKAVNPVTDGEKPSAEKEVMGLEPREIVSGSGQAQGPAVSGQPVPHGPSSGPVVGAQGTATSEDSGVVAILQIRSDVSSVQTAFEPFARDNKPGQTLHTTVAKENLGFAIVLMARILEDFPSVVTGVDPASLKSRVSRADALQQLEDTVSGLLATIKGSRVALLVGAWRDTRDAYRVADRGSPDNPTLDQRLVPLRALFQRTPRAVKAAADQGLTARSATNAATRASKAAAKATAAQQRAARLNPPAPQPSGVDQGPSHSTTAGTPATPGTPGTR